MAKAKKLLSVQIREAVGAAAVRVDRAAGVIYGVKVVGRDSPNRHELPVDGTIYTPEALEAALHLYENANVNLNHPSRKDPTADYPVEQGIGQLRNCRVENGELYADLHILTKHPFADQLFEAAERMPTMFGLSHNAGGKGQIEGGKLVIREIPYVRSVDLVRDPGTVRGLFESRERLEQLLESAFEELVEKLKKEGHSEESARKIAYSIGAKKYGKAGMAKKSAAAKESREDPMKKARTLFEAFKKDLKIKDDEVKLIFEATGMNAKCMEDEEYPESEEPTAKDHIGEAVRAVFHDDSIDDAAKLKKIRQLVKAAGEEEPVEEADEEPKEEPKDEEEGKVKESLEHRLSAIETENRQLKKEKQVRQLCEAAKFEPGQQMLKALLALPGEKEIKALIQEAKQAQAPRRPVVAPRTGQHIANVTESREMPENAKDFAAALLS